MNLTQIKERKIKKMTDIIQLQSFNVYIGLAITGLCTGLGSAIGGYLANKHLIQGSENIANKIKNKMKDGLQKKK